MALRSEILDRKYIFGHDLGLWGFGSMGVLQDRQTGEEVTCKTVSKALVRDHSSITARLLRLNELKHPHVCTICEVLEDQRNFFIISGKTRGGDIDNWLNEFDEETHWIAETTVAAYIGQALVALAHCHSINVFHHDLKPNNVLLSSKLPDAIVMVSDFGVPSILDPESTMLRRSPNPYAAPELLSGSKRVSGGAPDMWSIGAIARAMLIGRKPDQEKGWEALTRPMTGSSLAGVAQSFGISGFEDVWVDRSPASRDFVERLLQPAGDRPTAARMLQHPWLRTTVIPSVSDTLAADYAVKDIHQKTLCYVLATLLAPGLVGHADMQQLRLALMKADNDYDGLVSRQAAKDLLGAHGVGRDTAATALALADVRATGVIGLCTTTVALVLSRTLLEAPARGAPAPGAGPLDPNAASQRMTEILFETYCNKTQPTIPTSELLNRLRTPTGRELEEFAGVSFEEVLGNLPEDSELDRRVLVQGLTAGGGKGTPVCFGFGSNVLPDEHNQEDYESCWDPTGLAAITFFIKNAMQTCGVGHYALKTTDPDSFIAKGTSLWLAQDNTSEDSDSD